jgi:hypothetical protein
MLLPQQIAKHALILQATYPLVNALAKTNTLMMVLLNVKVRILSKYSKGCPISCMKCTSLTLCTDCGVNNSNHRTLNGA